MPPAAAAVPPRSRTNLYDVVVAGHGGSWAVDGESPLPQSLPFIHWVKPGAPTRPHAAKLSMVGLALPAARKPTAADWARLRAFSILEKKLVKNELQDVLHELDKLNAFQKVYSSYDLWLEALPGLLAQLASLDSMRLTTAFFEDGEPFDDPGGRGGRRAVTGRPELKFIHLVTIGRLLDMDDSPDEVGFCPLALSRAFILLGDKDTQELRSDDMSTICIHAEAITGLLKRRVGNPTLSDSALAVAFSQAMHDLMLPHIFRMHTLESTTLMAELTAALDIYQGTPSQARAVEISRILRTPRHFPYVGAVVGRFKDPHMASFEVDRLASGLLSTSLASSPALLTKLSGLEAVLKRASWQASVQQCINAQPGITGSELVTAASCHDWPPSYVSACRSRSSGVCSSGCRSRCRMRWP